MNDARRITPGQWELLKAVPSRAGELRAATTGVTVASGEVMIALDSAQRRHLLVPVAVPEDVRCDSRGSGCRVSARELLGYGGLHFADLECLNREASEVFGLLADDVLRRIEDGAAPSGAVCAEALDDWRGLLGGSGGRHPGPSEMLGLFGELWILRRLVQISPAALQSWLGPLGAPHDFSFGRSALEVKTTSSATGTACQIHGLKQLTPPQEAKLYLALVRVEQRPGLGETIVDLLLQLQQMGVNHAGLVDRLDALRYRDAESEPYAGRQWSPVEFSIWPVTVDFPSITPATFPNGTVPSGIISVNYVLDLAFAGPALDEAEREAVLGALAGRVEA